MGGPQQRPWTPTKRRGPIAAEFASPGPAVVLLPSLIGKAASHASSLHYRHPEPKQFVTPAPGQYEAEKVTLDTSPKYSFGLKPKLEVKSSTPAPNVYTIPPVLGNSPEGTKKKAPAYTISGRGKEFVDFRVTNPGPGKYDSGNLNIVKKKAPSFSLSVRTQLPSDATKIPGPGAHNPEKIAIQQAAPSHTFGIKHSPYTAPLKT